MRPAAGYSRDCRAPLPAGCWSDSRAVHAPRVRRHGPVERTHPQDLVRPHRAHTGAAHERQDDLRGKSWATLQFEASGAGGGLRRSGADQRIQPYTTRPRRTRRGCRSVAALSDRHQAARRDRALRRSRERPLPRPHRCASPTRPRTGSHAAGRGMPRRLHLARQTVVAAAPDG